MFSASERKKKISDGIYHILQKWNMLIKAEIIHVKFAF